MDAGDGVSKDSKYECAGDAETIFYVPLRQNFATGPGLNIRTR